MLAESPSLSRASLWASAAAAILDVAAIALFGATLAGLDLAIPMPGGVEMLIAAVFVLLAPAVALVAVALGVVARWREPGGYSRLAVWIGLAAFVGTLLFGLMAFSVG